ncbi:MAG: STAS domain-containing protein [Ruminococcaceae bacterium]|nr:STAS domain-containing protein [Oscillospiraceae bacterium]
MEKLQPKLISCLKGYRGGQLARDVMAGIIVAIIALPLSIALAIASGVGPEQGLYTAIFAGFVISLLGGSRVQIAGPTAAFASIVAGIVATEGMQGLAIATILAGILLVLMGVLRLGSLIRFIPRTITVGFTAGIAVTIAIGQVKDFLGLVFTHAPVETMEKVEAIAGSLGTMNPTALLVGLLALAILIIAPKIPGLKRVPPSLIAILVCAVLVALCRLNVNTIGDLYTVSSALPKPVLPGISLQSILHAFPNAVTIAVLAAVESLLSCVVADGMIGDKHNSNMELVAQGAGNICSALFGGIPATGAIARTAANIKNGGRSPVAGMVHAILLLLVLVLLMPYASLIPMPVIAAILFIVAYNMSEWREFVSICKTSPKSDILILVLTFVLTVVFDLVVAIAVGIVLSTILFMKRMADETNVVRRDTAPANVAVYDITGPLFFGAADKLATAGDPGEVSAVVLCMQSVPAADASGIHQLESVSHTLADRGITLLLTGVRPQPMKVLQKAGLYESLGANSFFESEEAALRHVTAL